MTQRGMAFRWGVVDTAEYTADREGDVDEPKIVSIEIPLPPGGIDEIIQNLHKHARSVLGPGQPYEIRRAIPYNYGRGHGMAWVEGHTSPLASIVGPASLGYSLVGQFTT